MEDQRGIVSEVCSRCRKVETLAVDQADGSESEPVHGGAGQQEDHSHGGKPMQHLDS
jgi:hypothetical protein